MPFQVVWRANALATFHLARDSIIYYFSSVQFHCLSAPITKWWLIFICSNIYLFADLLKYHRSLGHTVCVCIVLPLRLPRAHLTRHKLNLLHFREWIMCAKFMGANEPRTQTHIQLKTMKTHSTHKATMAIALITFLLLHLYRLCASYQIAYSISVASFFNFIFRIYRALANVGISKPIFSALFQHNNV